MQEHPFIQYVVKASFDEWVRFFEDWPDDRHQAIIESWKEEYRKAGGTEAQIRIFASELQKAAQVVRLQRAADRWLQRQQPQG